MAAAHVSPNRIDFNNKTSSTHGPYQARGPVGIVIAGEIGSGSVLIRPWCGTGFVDIPSLSFSEPVAKKVDFAGGDRFEIEFRDCTAAQATLTFYALSEQ